MKIEIELTTFYSCGDEDRFFVALEAIPGLTRIVGVGRGLVLTLNVSRLSRQSLMELIALLYRYGISLKSLGRLAVKPKFAWLKEPEWYWASSMYAETSVCDDSRPGSPA